MGGEGGSKRKEERGGEEREAKQAISADESEERRMENMGLG
jgi:hypothetical protein